jgi:hypothetical protein
MCGYDLFAQHAGCGANRFSARFNEFVATCLVKAPAQRATASALTQHAFLTSAAGASVLLDIINEELAVIAQFGRDAALGLEDDDDEAAHDDDDDAFGDAAGQGTTIIRQSRIVSEAENVDFSSATMVVATGDDDADPFSTMKVNDSDYVPQWRQAMDAQANDAASKVPMLLLHTYSLTHTLSHTRLYTYSFIHNIFD